MHDAQGLLSMLRELRKDPNLREFRPVLDEMIKGIEVPEYDNTQRVLKLFSENALSYHCREIAEFLWQMSSMAMPNKKQSYMDE